MTGKRKRYSAEFKAKVALDAVCGEQTIAQLAAKHCIVAASPQQLSNVIPHLADIVKHVSAEPFQSNDSIVAFDISVLLPLLDPKADLNPLPEGAVQS